MFGQLVSESTLPVRKRRRPALSCVECRRRKIKCDRNDPCNHCKSSKNTVCVYKDAHPAVGRHSSATPSVTPVNQRIQNTPSEGYEFLSEDSSFITTPAVSHVSLSEKDRSSLPSPGGNSVDEDRQGFAERVKKTLPDAINYTGEDKSSMGLQAMGLDFSTFNDILVQDGNIGARIRTKFFNAKVLKSNEALRGSYSKTRFFGQSHWMNSFEQVINLQCLSRIELTPPSSTK